MGVAGEIVFQNLAKAVLRIEVMESNDGFVRVVRVTTMKDLMA